jgi:CDP-diacylglycerol--inositol 3-phosphatidyltransferase
MNRVFLYVPNIIGYLRAVLLIVAFFFALNAPVVFIILYAVSYLLDALDGLTSRALNQDSRFGASLDMVIDRSSTTCLLAILAWRYPEAAPLLLVLISLDLSSHYLHMQTTSKASHKKTTLGQHGRVLHLYYSSRPFLTTLCFGHEAAALSLYAFSFLSAPIAQAILSSFQASAPWWQPVLALVLLVTVPIGVLKTYISLVQLILACRLLAAE